MRKRTSLMFLVLTLVTALFFTSGGCGGDSSPERGKLLDSQKIEALNADTSADVQLATVQITALNSSVLNPGNDPVNDIWKDLLKWLTDHFTHIWSCHKLTYASKTADGKAVSLSGAVIYPYLRIDGKTPADKRVPILIMPHPTQVERKYSPSIMLEHIIEYKDPQAMVYLGMLAATTGYIVFMPDYVGMGINRDIHPYCHESLADSIVDMIPATLEHIQSIPYLKKNVEWNGAIYISGYSEGGYASMAAAKALQNDPRFKNSIKGAAPVDGPYSLAGAMKTVIISADAAYPSPYFLPYVLNGYASVYEKAIPNFAFKRTVRSDTPNESLAGSLLTVMDGEHSDSDINNVMRSAKPLYEGPRSILSSEFLQSLNDPASKPCDILKQNSSFYDWSPQFPMEMFHHVSDDLVPYANMTEAKAAFGSNPYVTASSYEGYLNIGSSMHENAAPFGIIYGYMWVDKLAYPDRHKP